jgi:excisionase family DNA binding protein
MERENINKDMVLQTGRLLNITDVSVKLGVSTRHIRNMVRKQEMPAPVKVGKRSVRWHEREIETYILGLR